MEEKEKQFSSPFIALLYYSVHPNIVVFLFITIIEALLLIGKFLWVTLASPYWFILIGVLGLYLIAAVILNLKRWFYQLKSYIHEHPSLHSFLISPDKKAVFNLHIATGIDVIYAIIKIALSIYYSSPYQAGFAFYYILLSSFLAYLTLQFWKSRTDDPLIQEGKQIKLYRRSGLGLLVLDLAVIALLVISLFNPDDSNLPFFIIVFTGIYSLYRVIITVIFFYKGRRNLRPLSYTTRCFDLAAAFVSFYAFASTLLFYLKNNYINDKNYDAFFLGLNIGIGALVIILIISVSIYMFNDARKRTLYHKKKEKDLNETLRRSVENGDLRF